MCNNGSSCVYSSVSDSGDTGSEEVTHSAEASTIIVDEYEIQIEEDCQENIMELGEEVSSLRQQIQELLSIKELHQGQIESLSQEVQDLNGKIDELRKQLKEKHKSETSLKEEVKQLQIEVNELRHKLADYERGVSNQDKLYLSQVAVEFERAICSHVIPEVFSRNRNTKIDTLLNMLNSGDQGYVPLDRKKYTESDIEAILSRARPRWEKLCDDLKLPSKWKKITGKEIDFSHYSVPKIFRAMALLKRERNPVAHPSPVSVQEAKKKVDATSIRNELEDWELELVEDFISGLKKRIETSGIKIDKERLRLD